MEKIIKKYGNSFVLKLDDEDMKIHDLKEGDIVSITITKIRNIKSKK